MRILVVGVNNFGQMHLSAIKNMDISIVERKPEVVEKSLEKFKINKVYSSYDEALNDKFDIVDLIVPHHLHREMAMKAMEMGSNVLLEKPIATSIEDAEDLITASRKFNVKFMVTDQYYFDPSVREAVKIIKNGEIGKPISIVVRDQRYYTHKGWRTSSSDMGGGSLIDGGIHFIDTLLNFGGDYDSIDGISRHGGSALQGEDTTNAIFKFKNGSTGLFFYTWAYREPPVVPAFEVIGDRGSFYEDPASRTDWGVETHNRTVYGDLVLNGKNLNIKKYDVYEKEIGDFAKSVENDTPVPFPPETALRDLKAVLKIYNMS
jgi:predicted dehydrogenase